MIIKENEDKKLTVSLSNFSAGNTPEALQKWADWALKLAAVAIIVGGTISAPPINHPEIGGNIVMYAGVIGTMFKSIAKLFGVSIKE